MKVGLWGARGDRRGLAIQSGTLARLMRPDRVMGIEVFGGKEDWRDFEGLNLTTVRFEVLSEGHFDAWSKGLDVIWGTETFYHDELPAWARARGIATAIHVNPEFYRYELEPAMPHPDMVVTPTEWRLSEMPLVREVIASPIDFERCTFSTRPRMSPEPLTFLHVMGHPAARDRNGSQVLAEALNHVTEPCRLIVRTQVFDPHVHGPHPFQSTRVGVVDIDVRIDDIADYWRLYEDADVLVLPRRYGGQSLPAQEAMASGLVVLMSRLSPQMNGWLTEDCLITADEDPGPFRTQAGNVVVHNPRPIELAQAMDALSRDHSRVQALSLRNRAYAQEHWHWDRLEPQYHGVLKRAYSAHGR